MDFFKNEYFYNSLPELISETLINQEINASTAQEIINKERSTPNNIHIDNNAIQTLHKAIHFCLNDIAINRSLNFKEKQKLITIIGAGIAGLSCAFELLRAGFKVVILEKRESFNRFNVINLDVESQRFLKKFNLLNDFEKNVAARIRMHKYVHFDKNSMQNLGSNDVGALQHTQIPFEPESLDNFFTQDGIYSVRIKDLQNFLAQKVLDAGARIFGNVEVEILSKTPAGGVSEIQIKNKTSCYDPIKLQPHLCFIADGAHSITADQLGMNKDEIHNECTSENWIFGNAQYSGSETFVVSVIDTSANNLKIANIIFNAQIHEINIAVTSKENLNQKIICKQIIGMLNKVFASQQMQEPPQSLLEIVKNPVHIKNEKRIEYSKDNVFAFGDAAGHSSPLAGMGGSLSMTIVPHIVERLIKDLNEQSNKVHDNFNQMTDASISRWINKSAGVKKHCLQFFDNKVVITKQEQVLETKVGSAI